MTPQRPSPLPNLTRAARIALTFSITADANALFDRTPGFHELGALVGEAAAAVTTKGVAFTRPSGIAALAVRSVRLQ